MSSRKLIIFATLLAFCLCLPQKKSCARPSAFKGANEVVEYVKCIKTLTGPPVYGKRSVPPPSLFFQKLQALLRNYGEDADYSDDFLYRLDSDQDLQK